MHMIRKQMAFQYLAFSLLCQFMQNFSQICSYSFEYFSFSYIWVSILHDNCIPMLNGLGFELPLLTSFPDTSNGSGKEVFFIARKVKLCESPSKAGGLPILIMKCLLVLLSSTWSIHQQLFFFTGYCSINAVTLQRE